MTGQATRVSDWQRPIFSNGIFSKLIFRAGDEIEFHSILTHRDLKVKGDFCSVFWKSFRRIPRLWLPLLGSPAQGESCPPKAFVRALERVKVRREDLAAAGKEVNYAGLRRFGLQVLFAFLEFVEQTLGVFLQFFE